MVLAVGRCARQKGFDILLDAVVTLQDRDPAPRLVIAGDGPLAGRWPRSRRRQAPTCGSSAPRTDIPALLAVADVVVVPSRWEGQPLIVQEALRAGRPLVASRVGGIPALTGQDGALLVPPDDPARLAAAVASVLDDPVLSGHLAAAAAARAGTLPSPSDAIDAAVAVYARLARPDPHRPVARADSRRGLDASPLPAPPRRSHRSSIFAEACSHALICNTREIKVKILHFG